MILVLLPFCRTRMVPDSAPLRSREHPFTAVGSAAEVLFPEEAFPEELFPEEEEEEEGLEEEAEEEEEPEEVFPEEEDWEDPCACVPCWEAVPEFSVPEEAEEELSSVSFFASACFFASCCALATAFTDRLAASAESTGRERTRSCGSNFNSSSGNSGYDRSI